MTQHLTPQQLHHLVHLNAEFNVLNFEKYRKGAIEHGGNLTDLTVLDLLYNLREEAIDAYVYCQTAIDKLENNDVS